MPKPRPLPPKLLTLPPAAIAPTKTAKGAFCRKLPKPLPSAPCKLPPANRPNRCKPPKSALSTAAMPLHPHVPPPLPPCKPHRTDTAAARLTHRINVNVAPLLRRPRFARRCALYPL